MGRHAERRLPIGPLLALCGNPDDPGPAARTLAERLGVTRRTVYRWVAEGAVPEAMADRACVASGAHPDEVWPTEWWAVPLEPEPEYEQAALDVDVPTVAVAGRGRRAGGARRRARR